MDDESSTFSSITLDRISRREAAEDDLKTVTAFEQRDLLLNKLATSWGYSLIYVNRTLESCRYLDPYPEDVEEEFSSLLRRLEQLGQEGKCAVLHGLWRKGLRDSYGGVFDQIDYGHRVLLFLMKLSGNIESSLVTRECGEVLARCGAKRHSVEYDDATIIRELMLEDEEDEEGQWWRRNIAYSSGEELSDWSDEDAEHEDRNAAIDSVPESLKCEQSTPVMPAAPIMDDEHEAAMFMRQRVQTAVRSRRTGKATVGYKRLYNPMALSVWLSSKICTTHVSDVLHPKYCVSEDVFVSQMLYCIRGFKSPGFLCSGGGPAAYRIAQGVHLEDVSVDTISHISDMVLRVANSLRTVDGFVLAATQCGHVQSIWSSYAAALERQVKICRNYITTIMHEGRPSVSELVCVVSTMEDPAVFLESLCLEIPAPGDDEDEHCQNSLVKDVVERSQRVIEEYHLECSSWRNAYMMAMVVEIFVSTCIPLLKVMDAWMQHGDRTEMASNDDESLIKDVAPPKMLEELMEDVHMIGLWSGPGEGHDDSTRLAQLAVDVSRRYIASVRFHSDKEEEEDVDNGASSSSSHGKDEQTSGFCHSWAREWMAAIHEGDPSLSKEQVSRLEVPWHEVNPSDHSVPFEHLLKGIGDHMKESMERSSKNRFDKFIRERGTVSTWCAGDSQISVIHRLRQHVMHKVESIVTPGGAGETPQQTSPVWPLSPPVEIQRDAARVIGGYGALMRQDAISMGLVAQVCALKSILILDEEVWEPLVSAFLEACSSRVGVDSVAISNLNAILSDRVRDHDHLHKSMSSLWLEGLSAGGIETSFTSRKTAYVKIVRWHVELNAPLNTMLNSHALECISDLRDLVLQLKWVWKTVSNARKHCLKLRDNSIVAREHHTCLFCILVFLRHVMLSLHMYVDVIWDNLINRLEDMEALLQMRQAIDTAISKLSNGEFSHNMPFRHSLGIWLDASLAYGILVNRFVQNHDATEASSLDAFSPNSTSYSTGLQAARAAVWHATKNMMSLLEGAKSDHAMLYHHLLVNLEGNRL